MSNNFAVKPIYPPHVAPWGKAEGTPFAEIADDDILAWYGAVITKESTRACALAEVRKRGLEYLMAKKIAAEAIKKSKAESTAKLAAADDRLREEAEVVLVPAIAAKAFQAKREARASYWESAGAPMRVKCPKCGEESSLQLASTPHG